ncbi:MAG: hypothetical protein F6K09_28960, partial [Merismopedia sp. SIO2A8]|nr:hypothetical protein [Merismopedia sp. SIO2A8]
MTDIPRLPNSSSDPLPPDHLSPIHLSPENERSLKTLLRTIELTRGSESMMKLVRCNYVALRSQVIQRLKQDCPVEIQELWLEPFTSTLTEAIATAQTANSSNTNAVLSVQGIEQVTALDDFLAAANRSRDSLQQHLALPVILWVTNDVVERMIRIAPDLWNFIS